LLRGRDRRALLPCPLACWLYAVSVRVVPRRSVLLLQSAGRPSECARRPAQAQGAGLGLEMTRRPFEPPAPRSDPATTDLHLRWACPAVALACSTERERAGGDRLVSAGLERALSLLSPSFGCPAVAELSPSCGFKRTPSLRDTIWLAWIGYQAGSGDVSTTGWIRTSGAPVVTRTSSRFPSGQRDEHFSSSCSEGDELVDVCLIRAWTDSAVHRWRGQGHAIDRRAPWSATERAATARWKQKVVARARRPNCRQLLLESLGQARSARREEPHPCCWLPGSFWPAG
jgi:hypothetical protein